MSEHTAKKLWLFGAAGCSALWIAAVWAPSPVAEHSALPSERGTETSPSDAASVAADTTALSERAAMRARLNELERKLASAAATPASPAAKAPAPMPTPKEVERSDHLQQASVATRLDAEPVDETWRAATEAKVLQALKSSPEPDAVVLGASCRSSHCRVQLDLQAIAPEDRQLAIARVMSSIPWNSQAFYQPDTLDSSNTTGALYLSREGREAALQSGELALSAR